MTAPPEFSRPLAVDKLGAAPLEREVTATAAECAALAARFAIPGVVSLACRFQLRREAGGRIAATGTLRARVVRECVVTLEPFETAQDEVFSVVFVPAGSEADDADPESVDEIPYAGGSIDLGEAAAEQLALALDPYPRKPGAELPAEAGEAPESPFVALARRRGNA